MGVLLIILQIVGALPGVIDFLKMLWEYIEQIKGREEKAIAKKKFKKLVFRRQAIRKMSEQENADLMTEAQALYHDVQSTLAKEHRL